MSGFIGAGDVLLNPKDPVTGLFKGWSAPLFASRFEPKANAELKELKSKGRNTYGQVIGSVALQQPAEFNMTLMDADKDAITLLFLGTQSAIAVTGASVTGESINLQPGRRGRTAFGAISAVTIASYAIGTDFTVENARLGTIAVVPGSSLATAVTGAGAAGLDVTVDYTYASQSGVRISAADQPSVRAAIAFDGKNVESGEAVECDIWEVVLTPDAGFDFLADDWNEVPLSGRMVTPVGKSQPFEVRFPT